MRYGYVVDASASRITRADFRALKEMGVQGFIQCLQTGGFSADQKTVASVAPYNLDDSLTEGLATGGYINSQPWRPVSVIVNDGKAVAASAWPHLKMVSNDMEIQGITEAQCLATTLAIEAEGKLSPAYTAWWFAAAYGGMRWPWLAAPNRGGWDADYDGRPAIEPIAWGPSGIYPVGKQYKGSTLINGDTYDLNIFDLDYLTREEDDDMAGLLPEDKEWFQNLLRDFAAAHLNGVASRVGEGNPSTQDVMNVVRALQGGTGGGGGLTLAQALRQVADALE